MTVDGTCLLQDGKYLWYNAPYGLGMQNNKSGLLENLFPGLPSETAYLYIMSEEPLVTLGLYEDVKRKMLDVLYLK